MTLSQAYLLAHDSEFRVLAGFTSPPRAATVTALEPSGQARLALDDADGADVLAWPLNGFVYGVGDVVYVLFAANSPDSALVLGAKAPLPSLDAAVFAHDHAADYVDRDGSTPLTGDWDLGDGRKVKGDKVTAWDGDGLRLEDDGGNLGVFVADGGNVGVGTNAPEYTLEAAKSGDSAILSAFSASGTDSHRPIMLFRRALGTLASLATVTAATWLASFQANAFNGASWRTAAGIDFFVDGGIVSNRPRGQIVMSLGDDAGAYTEMFRLKSGKTLGLFGASPSPQGPLHVHNGVGGLIFVTKSGVDGTAQTILPNAAGDVTKGLAGLVVVSDGTVGVAGQTTLTPGGNQDIGAGTLTVRLSCAADGSVTIKRQSGTGTATVALVGVWV